MDNQLRFMTSVRTPYALELTPAQLKITHAALRALLEGLGREPDARRVIRSVMAKLPDDAAIRAINFGAELRRERRESDPRTAPATSNGRP